MKKITDFIRRSLSMSPSEAKGVIFIFGAMILIFGGIFLSDYLFSQKQQTVIISSPESLDSLSVTLNSKPNYNSNYKNFDKQSYANSDSRSIKLFKFDPNTASVEQFQSLGLPKFIAERIEKYRSKGGKFKKKEDFAKIYGLRTEDYERLEPFITLPSVESESSPQEQMTVLNTAERRTENAKTEVIEKTETRNFKPETKTLSKFDLNTCDTTDLKKINGIGSGYAKRIIKFRDILGGFANAEQVRETIGLPPETADELLKYGFVKGGFRKLKINEVNDFYHPYLKKYQVKAIVAYREQHGKFKSADDLKPIKVLDESIIEKIKPYLEF